MSSKKNWILPTNEEFIREFAPELLEMSGYALPIKLDGRGARPTVFNFALDASDSMWMYYHEMVDTFNQVMIPALKEYRRYSNDPYLIGGTLFSNKLIPMRYGFPNVNELNDEPLTLSQFGAKGLRGRTALYKAMISALLWTHRAMEQIKRDFPSRAGGVQGKVCILTDGANDLAPFEAKLVYSILDAVAPVNKRGRRKIQTTLVFLKTDSGLSVNAAQRIAEETGFEFSGFYDINRKSFNSNEISLFDLWEHKMIGS